MEKFFYCIGVYCFCNFVDEVAHQAIKVINKKITKKLNEIKEEEPHRSKNLSEKKVGGPINRIGF